MRIQLDDEWLIDGDETSVSLIRLRTVTGENSRGRAPNPENIGRQREETCGFYGSVRDACLGYLRKRQNASTSTTAEDLIALTEQAVTAIIDATKDIPKAALTK